MAGLGHVAIGMAAARWYNSGAEPASRRQLVLSMVAFSALSMAPDLDVWAFKLHIPYEAPFGHRGASHSILVAVILGPLLALLLRARAGLSRSKVSIAVLMTLVVLSHGFLDTLTFGGGHGVALLWPFDNTRLWAPLRFIPVSPLGFGILSPYGLTVLGTELLMFSPFWLYAVAPQKRAHA